MTGSDISIEEQRELTLWPFVEASEHGLDDFCRLLIHVGITVVDLDQSASAEEAILHHYRKPTGYDWEKVADDLVRYPPIANRIRQLREEKQVRQEHDATVRRERKRRTNGHAPREFAYDFGSA